MAQFLKNLKNKMLYKVHTWVTDPEAEKYAEKQQEYTETKTKNIPFNQSKTIPIVDFIRAKLKRHTHDAFDVNSIWDSIMTYLPMIVVPFFAFLVAIAVANEAIVYPAPIRFGFFTFVIGMGFVSTPFIIVMFAFYVIKWLYQKYLQFFTTDRKDEKIMPTIFAMLPLFEYTGQGFFGKFFHYPRTAKQFMELKRLMDLHQVHLTESFPYVEVVSKNNIFVEALRKSGEALIQTHFGMDLNKQFVSPDVIKEEEQNAVEKEEQKEEQNAVEKAEQKVEQNAVEKAEQKVEQKEEQKAVQKEEQKGVQKAEKI